MGNKGELQGKVSGSNVWKLPPLGHQNTGLKQFMSRAMNNRAYIMPHREHRKQGEMLPEQVGKIENKGIVGKETKQNEQIATKTKREAIHQVHSQIHGESWLSFIPCPGPSPAMGNFEQISLDRR